MSANDPLEIVCTEELVATLRDPQVLAQGIVRNIYVTSRSLGSEGATGIMRQGDLTGDKNAKIVYFNAESNAFCVIRNGNPPQPEEQVPDADIGPLLRSFVRNQSAFEPVYVTVTDMLPGRGIETVRKVIPARNVELYCQHGPHPSARGAAFTSADLQSSVSWWMIAAVVICIALAWYVYTRFVRKHPPPEKLPDMRPFMVEQRHGAKRLRFGDVQDKVDVKNALDKIR